VRIKSNSKAVKSGKQAGQPLPIQGKSAPGFGGGSPEFHSAPAKSQPKEAQDLIYKPDGKPLRIVIYMGADPSADAHNVFYLNLFWKIMLLCRERKIECEPLIDSRPIYRQTEISPDLANALKNGAYDGLILTMISMHHERALKSCHVPFAVQTLDKSDSSVEYDHRQMIRIALRRLADLGCQSVGLILPEDLADASMLDYIKSISSRLSLNVEYEWMLISRQARQAPEEEGHKLFHALWSLKKRPQGLIVWPDLMVRGVITAIIERRVLVPRDLKLVLHRNAESPIMEPFPVDWAESSVGPMAEGLLLQIMKQINGESTKRIKIPFRIVSEDASSD